LFGESGEYDLSLGLDFNHGAKGQVIFSRLSKQEGETFTSLSVTIADQE
jgi:hypothetical protein